LHLVLTWKQYGFTGEHLTAAATEFRVQAMIDRKVAVPGDLDMLWTAIFVTGKERFPDLVLDAVSSDNPDVAQTTGWSLDSNYAHHEGGAAVIPGPAGKMERYPPATLTGTDVRTCREHAE